MEIRESRQSWSSTPSTPPTCRNPLEIRASRQSLTRRAAAARCGVVIPWKSGQVVRAADWQLWFSVVVVIPWKSGQVVRGSGLSYRPQGQGRNPLEIRASRQRFCQLRRAGDLHVVIPWKSGQVVRAMLLTCWRSASRRNPLEIRASRQRPTAGHR